MFRVHQTVELLSPWPLSIVGRRACVCETKIADYRGKGINYMVVSHSLSGTTQHALRLTSSAKSNGLMLEGTGALLP